MWGNWETEHHNSVLEITGQAVLFLGIHKSEPEIYTGFSGALNLQCGKAAGKILPLIADM